MLCLSDMSIQAHVLMTNLQYMLMTNPQYMLMTNLQHMLMTNLQYMLMTNLQCSADQATEQQCLTKPTSCNTLDSNSCGGMLPAEYGRFCKDLFTSAYSFTAQAACIIERRQQELIPD